MDIIWYHPEPLLKRFSFLPVNCSGISLKNQTIRSYVNFWALYSILLNHVFILIQVPGGLDYYRFIVSQSGSISVPILFSFKISLDVPGTLHVHRHFIYLFLVIFLQFFGCFYFFYTFGNQHVNFHKKACSYDGDCMFNLHINTRRKDIVTII